MFLGYVYAYGLTRWLPRKTQVLVHLATIALTVAVVPIGIGPDVGPPLTANPLFWFLGLLSLSVGLPFFAVATTAPLLQRWYGYMLGANTDPYFLYAASNLGGLLALVGYPVFIEPALGLTEQSFAWGVAYAGLVVLIGVLGFQLLRRQRPGRITGPSR